MSQAGTRWTGGDPRRVSKRPIPTGDQAPTSHPRRAAEAAWLPAYYRWRRARHTWEADQPGWVGSPVNQLSDEHRTRIQWMQRHPLADEHGNWLTSIWDASPSRGLQRATANKTSNLIWSNTLPSSESGCCLEYERRASFQCSNGTHDASSSGAAHSSSENISNSAGVGAATGLRCLATTAPTPAVRVLAAPQRGSRRACRPDPSRDVFPPRHAAQPANAETEAPTTAHHRGQPTPPDGS